MEVYRHASHEHWLWGAEFDEHTPDELVRGFVALVSTAHREGLIRTDGDGWIRTIAGSEGFQVDLVEPDAPDDPPRPSR